MARHFISSTLTRFQDMLTRAAESLGMSKSWTPRIPSKPQPLVSDLFVDEDKKDSSSSHKKDHLSELPPHPATELLNLPKASTLNQSTSDFSSKTLNNHAYVIPLIKEALETAQYPCAFEALELLYPPFSAYRSQPDHQPLPEPHQMHRSRSCLEVFHALIKGVLQLKDDEDGDYPESVLRTFLPGVLSRFEAAGFDFKTVEWPIFGRPALPLICFQYYPDLVKVLLDYGLPVDACLKNNNETALLQLTQLFAHRRDSCTTMKAFLNAGANPLQTDILGESVFHHLIEGLFALEHRQTSQYQNPLWRDDGLAMVNLLLPLLLESTPAVELQNIVHARFHPHYSIESSTYASAVIPVDSIYHQILTPISAAVLADELRVMTERTAAEPDRLALAGHPAQEGASAIDLDALISPPLDTTDSQTIAMLASSTRPRL